MTCMHLLPAVLWLILIMALASQIQRPLWRILFRRYNQCLAFSLNRLPGTCKLEYRTILCFVQQRCTAVFVNQSAKEHNTPADGLQ